MTDSPISFKQLGIAPALLKSLATLGYQKPTTVQTEAIPVMLAGRDLLAQAHTGTGKTAAFALPLLTTLAPTVTGPQVLVLTPTRELAIQVATAMRRYAQYLPDVKVLAIYGGQDARSQISAIKRGIQIVVGTPGRVMDLIRRRSLFLDKIQTLVLDEADEMLRMGFIDDVEWILEKMRAKRQIVLFSATIPNPIRKIASKYLQDPVPVTVKVRTMTAEGIRQRYWFVRGMPKSEALRRLLAVEPYRAVLIFTRTKSSSIELAGNLEDQGLSALPLNGDMQQSQREQTITRCRNGSLDILVATDVAARGLDVDRISHVINYDFPFDAEAYVHRIGRTGRAGRLGEAISFVTKSEKRLLRVVEQTTKMPIQEIEIPSNQSIEAHRSTLFKESIIAELSHETISPYRQMIREIEEEQQVSPAEIATALAGMLSKQRKPHTLQNANASKDKMQSVRARIKPIDKKTQSPSASSDYRQKPSATKVSKPKLRPDSKIGVSLAPYRIEIGAVNGLKPANIVGAIANEIGIESKHIQRIRIESEHSIVELPTNIPPEKLKHLSRVQVLGQTMCISRCENGGVRPAVRISKKQSNISKKKNTGRGKSRTISNKSYTSPSSTTEFSG